MMPLGLSVRDKRAYEAALRQTRRIRILARIHDRDEKVISQISNQDGKGRIIGGAVNVDMSQDPIRTLELTILQPKSAPAWLPDGPADYHVFANNFVSVLYGIYVRDLSDGPGWVDVPVFWGVVTGLTHDGTEVTIQASGKEILGLDPHLLWEPSFKVHRGRRRTAAIRAILARSGETRFDLPDLPQKLPEQLDLGRHAQPWRVAKSVAGGADWQLFYNGRGQAKVRRHPQNTVWTWKDDASSTILDRPSVSYDISSVRNIVEIMGPEPKGPPRRIRFVARAREKHKMSAEQLRRHGQKRYMVHTVDSNLQVPELEWHARQKIRRGDMIGVVKGHWGAPSGVKNPKRWFQWRHSVIVKRKNKAREIARRQLSNLLRASIETTFDTIPIPHLEEGDPCAISVDGWRIEFILKQFTIPLQGDAAMSIGVNKRVPKRQRKRRHKRKGEKR
jgi:hypothetical protein